MAPPRRDDACGSRVYRATISLRFSDKQDETLDGAGLRLRSGVATMVSMGGYVA